MAKQIFTMKRNGRWTSRGLDATKVAESLIALRKTHGAIHPEHLIDAARAADHPAHRAFEWEDSKAAHQYRLHQARELIRNVEIRWVEPAGPRQVDAEMKEGPAFVNPHRNGTGYFPIGEVLSDEEKRVALLKQALQDLLDVQHRYERFQELADVRVAIGKFAKAVTDVERKIKHKVATKRRVA